VEAGDAADGAAINADVGALQTALVQLAQDPAACGPRRRRI